jgi:hypothetical protein
MKLHRAHHPGVGHEADGAHQAVVQAHRVLLPELIAHRPLLGRQLRRRRHQRLDDVLLARPSVTWLDSWYRHPLASLPSPYRPRTVRPSFEIAWMTALIRWRWSAPQVQHRGGPHAVPVLVGQLVR